MQTIHTAAPLETDPSDAKLEALIARLAQGETAAMRPIYDMTSSAVYAYALTLLKHSFDAEDVLHDCYRRSSPLQKAGTLLRLRQRSEVCTTGDGG